MFEKDASFADNTVIMYEAETEDPLKELIGDIKHVKKWFDEMKFTIDITNHNH